ncbi:MTH1187 family thiamine-binding protein [Thiocystis violacea]|uniref:MTH1187 family thiamine-binding protein n=1 Tax=Thiocystis violacea TaxID=13725 RepID=UPI0019052D99|nr:MTH1187 family thiamine-binding protein [Thiocystis violacea]MBK1716791.1 hypothetical protein [Thiocystis violacea]
MSVILDLAIFPTDQGVSVSRFVAPVIALIRDSGFDFQLSPMGTQVETASLPEALALIEQAQSVLDGLGCERVYAIAKFDIRQGPLGRLRGKVDSVRQRIGEVERAG